MSEQITVVIPVKNEAGNIIPCIEAAKALGPVVVVDSGSEDATLRLAGDAGADVLNFEWNGKFPKKRNWVLMNYEFETEWILFLDADEFLTEAFCAEVKAVLPETAHSGFWLNYQNHFLGEVLSYGDRMRKLALFRIGAGEYERIEEDSWSHLDMEVHEHPVIKGTVGELKSQIVHLDYRGIDHWIAKHNAYSTWEANRYRALQGSGAAGWKKLNNRQYKKYRSLPQWWFAPAYFIASYIARRGFMDGRRGLHFALLKAWYFYVIRLKIKNDIRAQ